jgi:hypothetical protein
MMSRTIRVLLALVALFAGASGYAHAPDRV